MTDFGTALRASYIAALDGNVQYGIKDVPFMDDKAETDEFFYVRVTTQNMTSANTKSYFAGECDVNLQIVSVQRSATSKTIPEVIASQITDILFPTVTTNGLSIDAPYKISYAKLANTVDDIAIQTARGFEIKKTLVIRNRVIQ
jgi:hypothetical protein